LFSRHCINIINRFLVAVKKLNKKIQIRPCRWSRRGALEREQAVSTVVAGVHQGVPELEDGRVPRAHPRRGARRQPAPHGEWNSVTRRETRQGGAQLRARVADRAVPAGACLLLAPPARSFESPCEGGANPHLSKHK